MTQRHRFHTPRTYVPVGSGTVVEIGDLCGYDSGGSIVSADEVYTASQEPWDTDLATTQGNFADNYCGVAEARSDDGMTDLIPVRQTGVFQYPCASASFSLGDYVAPAENAGGDGLLDQELVGVTSTESIGTVYQAYTSSVTEILARLQGVQLP